MAPSGVAVDCHCSGTYTCSKSVEAVLRVFASSGVVNVFVNVVTKSTQRPQGIPSVTTYALTIDTKQNWVISDVSSIDGALGGKK
ncbi:hypothetical protein [Tsukamurella spumae]|uniref:hypothetical protein n=1 Tax=Tsukamurella spumae TaxID=44753 RepID=UPI0031DD38FA